MLNYLNKPTLEKHLKINEKKFEAQIRVR